MVLYKHFPKLIITPKKIFVCSVLPAAVSPMPVRVEVTDSSDDEHEEPLPKASPQKRGKKRKRQSESEPSKIDRSSDQQLRVTVAKNCACKKKVCLKQFIEPDLFSRLRDHCRYWHGLHKLDQDQAAFCLQNQSDLKTCFEDLAQIYVSNGQGFVHGLNLDLRLLTI